MVAFPTVLYATASLPVTDLKELIAWLRANPNKASAGVTTVSYRMVTFAPKGVPQEIIGKVNAAAVEALADQGVRSRLADLGYEVYPRERQTPEALGALRKADAVKWWPIIKDLGIKPE